nr:suppressor of disruption of TFIIS-like isoform X3 [Ipomoea batatas]
MFIFYFILSSQAKMEHEDHYQQDAEPKYECLLFDVDDTLYPFSSGISEQCYLKINEYMIEKLGIEATKSPEMCVQLYKDYGTTLAGLRAVGYDFDYDEFHSFVHGGLPYELLKPDPVLKNLIHSLPIRKVVFSNANEAHVAKVLSRLGLEDCFDDIICFETLNPIHNSSVQGMDGDSGLPKTPIVCKPFEGAFERAFEIAGINPHKTLFFDDSIRNLQTAKRTGLSTVRIGASQQTAGVDYALDSIHNMKEAIPEIWEAVQKSDVCYSEKTPIGVRA